MSALFRQFARRAPAAWLLQQMFNSFSVLVAFIRLQYRLVLALAAIAWASVVTVSVASAAPNLVANGDFQNYHYVYAPVANMQLPQPNSWTTLSPQILLGTSNPELIEWGFSEEDSMLRLGDGPNGQNIFYNGLAVSYPDPVPIGVVLSQVVSGLTPGHSYQLSFLTSGYTQIYPDNYQKYLTAPTPGWRVTFGTSGNGTAINGNSVPPFTDYPKSGSWWKSLPWISSTMKFVATASSQTLSFSNVASKVFSGDYSDGIYAYPGCVPCGGGQAAVQIQTLANVQLVDVTPAALPPTLSVQKALGTGGRANSADQFKVSILNATTSAVLGSGTTAGTGSTITGGLANITGDTTIRYKVVEEMVSGSVSNLAQYNAALSCTNANSAGTQFPAGSVSLGQNFPLLVAGDKVSCTVTNTAKPVTLQLRQLVQSPVPVNLSPPFTFSYTGNNGWSSSPLTNTSVNTFVSSAAVPLTALNTATTVSTTLPETRWFVSYFTCVDTNAAVTGNSTGILATGVGTSVTVPAAAVRAGAALRCTLLAGHLTP